MSRGWRGGFRRPRTWLWPSGSGSVPSFQRDPCGRSGCGRPTRTGRRSVIPPETRSRRGLELRRRFTPGDVAVLTEDEARRFVGVSPGDPRTDIALAWELLYRLEPQVYDRLVGAE